MGHIVNPTTLRIGITKNWNSIWSVNKSSLNYSSLYFSDNAFFFILMNFMRAKSFRQFSIILSHIKLIRFLNKTVFMVYMYNGSFLHNSIIWRRLFINDYYKKFLLYKFSFLNFIVFFRFKLIKKYKNYFSNNFKIIFIFFLFSFIKKIFFFIFFFMKKLIRFSNDFFFVKNIYLMIKNFSFSFCYFCFFKINFLLQILLKKNDFINRKMQKFINDFTFIRPYNLIFFSEFYFFNLKYKFPFNNYFNFFLKYVKSFLYNKYIIVWKLLKPFQITASVVSQYICVRFLQRFKLNEVLNPILKHFNKNKILKGYKIICSGRFTKKEIAVYHVKSFYSIPFNNISSFLDYSYNDVVLKYSLCGIKVFLNRIIINRKKKKKLLLKNVFLNFSKTNKFIYFLNFFINKYILKTKKKLNFKFKNLKFNFKYKSKKNRLFFVLKNRLFEKFKLGFRKKKFLKNKKIINKKFYNLKQKKKKKFNLNKRKNKKMYYNLNLKKKINLKKNKNKYKLKKKSKQIHVNFSKKNKI